MVDKYHKVVNGKTVAINLPKKATTLTVKQKKELKRICDDMNVWMKRFI
jgi:hypothetical protein